jgi:hypothetical protein
MGTEWTKLSPNANGEACQLNTYNVFKHILESSLSNLESDLQEKLLASKYVNSLIATCGLIPFYEIIEEYMERDGFPKVASRALLGQQALIDEYIKFPALIKEQINANSIYNLPASDYIKCLKFLSRLDEVNSIRFYRKYLAEPLANVYIDASDDLLHTLEPCEFVTDGIKKFLQPDIFLSPFTSFPFNRPVRLLLERPFERLYNDFYICDVHDIEQFVFRAYMIYKNFIDIILSGMVSEFIHLCDVEKFLNLYISCWNQAVLTIDGLYDHLKELDLSQNESESSLPIYHVYLDITGVQIMDINDKRLILDSIDGRRLNSYMDSYDNHWKEIYPCKCFPELGLETENKSFEKILSDINHTLTERFK